MPDIRASRESSVLLWVLSSYLVLRRVDSELIASKVTASGLVGWKPSIALTAVKLGTMNAKAATRIVASNAQRTAISFLLDLRGGARTAVASVARYAAGAGIGKAGKGAVGAGCGAAGAA